jgi:hypothetical protein
MYFALWVRVRIGGCARAGNSGGVFEPFANDGDGYDIVEICEQSY